MKNSTTIHYKNGDTYYGEVDENNLPSGKGVLKYSDQRKYKGTFKEGKLDGDGVFIVPLENGIFQYSGKFANNKYNGFGVATYPDGLKYIGHWQDNNLNGFGRIEYDLKSYGMVLSYDSIFENTQSIINAPFYDAENVAEHSLYDGGFRVYHPGHSAFIIETPTCNLILDWYQNYIPKLREDKPTYILFSHMHADHYNINVATALKDFNKVEVIVGVDHEDLLIKMENDLINMFIDYDNINVKLVSPKKLLTFDIDGTAEQLSFVFFPSTDMGVSTIIKTDSRRFFHAGDLAIWGANKYTIEDKKAKNRNVHEDDLIEALDNRALTLFKECAIELLGSKIDYAMLPMDMRCINNLGVRTVKEYLKMCKISFFTPMHLFNYIDSAVKEIERDQELLKKAWAVGVTNGYGQDAPLVFSKFCKLPLDELIIEEMLYDEDDKNGDNGFFVILPEEL